MVSFTFTIIISSTHSFGHSRDDILLLTVRVAVVEDGIEWN
jgi:hypothetical protein